MDRPQLPLNALRAFEAAARHLNLTRAAVELCVTQAALSHQVRALEKRLGVALFRRVPRGLVLTDEGVALVPVLTAAFDTVSDTLDRFVDGRFQQSLTVGVVSTFATGWLVPRLSWFEATRPDIDLRIHTNNNRVDIAGEGLDLAIRFGDGSWRATEARRLLDVEMTPVCAPHIASRLQSPADLNHETLLRSYRAGEWESWFLAQGLDAPQLRGPVFDNSVALAEMAAQGLGVALLPVQMFEVWIEAKRLVCPFSAGLAIGSYWLTRLHSREPHPASIAFSDWLFSEIAAAATPSPRDG